MNYPVKSGSSLSLTMTDIEYHGLPELSSTQAKDLLLSAARFNYWRGKRRPEKKAFDIGSAAHAKILGVGAAIAVIPDTMLAKDGAASTNAARDFVADAREKGLIPLKSSEVKPIDDMAESVLKHPTASKLLLRGNPEVSVITQDPVNDIGVRCRFDYLQLPREPLAIAADVKTTDDASPDAFVKTVLAYGYHISHEFYRDVYRWATGEEVEFAFIVVEKKAPYLVAQYRLDPKFIEMGQQKAEKARRLFAQYSGSGNWPGYPDTIEEIAPSYWAVLRHEEEFESDEDQVAA